MDNELTVFRCHHQRVELARQEWALQWHPPEWSDVKCPHCHATSFGKLMSRKGRKSHICNECRHTFSLDDVPGCHCIIPGQLLKCAGCKEYLDLVGYVRRRLPALQQLSDEEISKRSAPKKYVQRDMTRRSRSVEAQQELAFPEDVNHNWVQLSLLEADDAGG